jgi:methyltransferase (TIGR00027 family)
MRARITFEVDHPSTQAVKRRVVRRAAASAPNVRFVPVEFGRDDLADALTHAGHHRDERTLVIWEGVTNYLTADAVNTTFGTIARVVPSGSPVVFTYIDRRMLDGTLSFEGASESAKHVDRVGEPYTFGFDPSEVRGYLAPRGFELLSDTTVADAAARYMGNGASKGYAYYHVVEARKH